VDDIQLRREQKESAEEKVKKLGQNMKTALSVLSRSNEGQLILRYIMYECNFLAPLTRETVEGINKDILVGNEAKRRLYLSLRQHMDRETIMRIEIPETASQNKGGDQCQILT
jgi:hypothetical protein